MTVPSPAPPAPRRFDFRGLIAFLLLTSFLVMLASGIMVFLAPSGRVARQVGWTLLGLDRAQGQTLHVTFAAVFITAWLIHLACNWGGMLHHLRDRVSHHLTLKWEAILALLFTAWLIASAVFGLPPASTMHELNEFFRRTFWAETQHPAGQVPVAPGTRLPPGHPPAPAEAACIDCHRR